MKTKGVSSDLAAAALLAACAAAAGAAGAQDVARVATPEGEGVSAEQGAPEGEPETIVMQPENHRASALFETPVFDIEGTQIGELDDLVLSEDGAMVHAVLAIGGIVGIGEKLVLVPLDRLDLSPGEGGEGRPEDSIGLRGQTGRQLADAEPRFRYEPE